MTDNVTPPHPSRGPRARRKWVQVAPGCSIVIDGRRYTAGQRVEAPARVADDLVRRGSARSVT